MKKAIPFAVVFGAFLLSLGLAGCGDNGPSASTDQLTESRDKQFKAMEQQRKGMAAENQSAAAASKAGIKQ